MADEKNIPQNFSEDDARWMRRALELARAGEGLASPNPMVGCVVVNDGVAVGEGTHRYAEKDHAEVVALREADERAKGATVYVTLEPCSHTGRTPPCVNALVAARVKRVVAATLDANPVVRGRGMAMLREAGIDAQSGLLQDEAREIDYAFAKYITTGVPFVTLKAALSKDGYLAPSDDKRVPKQSYRLTSELANAMVQRMRHDVDAIVTGIGTVLMDDPMLTDRSGLVRRRPLLRVVMDSELRVPMDAKLVTSASEDVLVFCGADASAEKQAALEAAGVDVVRAAEQRARVDEVLRELAQRGVIHVMLEAGPKINGAFLEAQQVDEVVFFHTPQELGPGSVPWTNNQAPMELLEDTMQKMKLVRRGTLREDTVLRGLLRDPWNGV